MNALSVDSFHAVLFCRRWEACVAFYRDILGFPVVDRKQGFIEFEVAPGSRIGLIKSAAGSAFIKEGNAFLLSFRVGNVEAVQKLLSMRCRDVTAVKRHPWDARVFELRDPEGRRLEFWTPQ